MSESHGSTSAAWAAVSICLLGFALGAIGMVLGPNWTIFWIGIALLPLSAIVGKILSAASSSSSS